MFRYNILMTDGLYFEMFETPKNKEYTVRFVEYKEYNTNLLYETKMKSGMWAKIEKRYLSDYFVEIWDGEHRKENISVKKYLVGKKIFISFDSKALGDTLAWMPYCLEFKREYGGEIVVSTFMNHLFEKSYPELTFVGRGVMVDNITAMFELGWFYDDKKEPYHPATIPLQQAATNILGLKYKEIVCDLDFVPSERPIQEKYVTISTHSTAALKLWGNEKWQEVVNYLNEQGYKVIEVSKEESFFSGLTPMQDKSFENTMNYIHHSEFFIGLSSGLSWMAWALRKKVIMIANFTTKEHEFSTNCIRIVKESICHGCWNNPTFKFDKGNWMYCPEHEDTPKQFECHRGISVEDLITAIKEVRS